VLLSYVMFELYAASDFFHGVDIFLSIKVKKMQGSMLYLSLKI